MASHPGLRRSARAVRARLLVAILVLAVAGCAAPQLAGPRYGVDRFVHVHGHRLHYVEAGAGGPILLIPGAFTTYRAWSGVLPALSLHARVLAVDYLGVGDSDKPQAGFGYTVEEQADVLAGLLDGLALGRVSVVGASYGSAVALNLAARYPGLVDRVVCIEGGALILPEVLNYSRLGALLEWPILGDVIWAFMRSGLFDRQTARSVMGPAWADLPASRRDEITAIMAANIQGVSRSSWTGIYRAITRRIDFTAALRGSGLPVLYVYGEASKYRAVAEMNAERLGQLGLQSEVVAVAGGVHDLHLQDPPVVSGMILRFLGAHSPGSVGARADGSAAREATP